MAEASKAFAAARAMLFQAPLAEFVAERKRLAAGLKTSGDASGAKALAATTKPSASAWAVNQLHWQARQELEAMFTTAKKLRAGDLSATAAHRDALARLREQASKLLEAADHAATDAVLRRVTTSLAALAAIGSFAPDEPGELTADREPPGFEAASALAERPPREPAPATKPEHPRAAAPSAPDLKHAEAEARRKAAEREAAAKRLGEERKKIVDALDLAKGEAKSRASEQAAAEKAAASAKAAAERASQRVGELQAKLDQLQHSRSFQPKRL